LQGPPNQPQPPPGPPCRPHKPASTQQQPHHHYPRGHLLGPGGPGPAALPDPWAHSSDSDSEDASTSGAPDGSWRAAGSAAGRLRLYSLLPRALAGRAHVWGNRLALSEGAVCTDAPYFDAPGTRVSPPGGGERSLRAHAVFWTALPCGWLGLGGAVGSGVPALPRPRRALSRFPTPAPLPLPCTQVAPLAAPADALPRVTFVFVELEDGRTFQRRRRADARAVHLLASECLLRLLDGWPGGGYMCRMQDAQQLRYMLAFASPAQAVEWCIVAQEALMYLPWPPGALSWPAYGEQVAAGCGGGAAAGAPGLVAGGGGGGGGAQGAPRLLLRGPRFSMGVAAGCPRSIAPDHLGRADYHGAAVNLAARMVQSAAAGGQVVCELALAEEVLRCWQARGGGGGAPQAAEAAAAAAVAAIAGVLGGDGGAWGGSQGTAQALAWQGTPDPAPAGVSGQAVSEPLPMVRLDGFGAGGWEAEGGAAPAGLSPGAGGAAPHLGSHPQAGEQAALAAALAAGPVLVPCGASPPGAGGVGSPLRADAAPLQPLAQPHWGWQQKLELAVVHEGSPFQQQAGWGGGGAAAAGGGGGCSGQANSFTEGVSHLWRADSAVSDAAGGQPPWQAIALRRPSFERRGE